MESQTSKNTRFEMITSSTKTLKKNNTFVIIMYSHTSHELLENILIGSKKETTQ